MGKRKRQLSKTKARSTRTKSLRKTGLFAVPISSRNLHLNENSALLVILFFTILISSKLDKSCLQKENQPYWTGFHLDGWKVGLFSNSKVLKIISMKDEEIELSKFLLLETLMSRGVESKRKKLHERT